MAGPRSPQPGVRNEDRDEDMEVSTATAAEPGDECPYILTVIVYGVIQPADFHTFAILDATVKRRQRSYGSVIVASWLAYVLSKCWFQSACEWVSRATGIASNLALTLLFVVMIITVGPDLTLLHGGAIGFILIVAIGGRLIIELLARLPGVDIDSEVSWFPPCFAGGKAPSWW